MQMSKWIFLLLTIQGFHVSQQALAAQKVKIIAKRTTENILSLTVSDLSACSALENVTQNFQRWNKRTKGVHFSEIRKFPCRVELVLKPDHIMAQTLNKGTSNLGVEGPNCWNAALNGAGILKGLYRYSSFEEFGASLDFFCTKRTGAPVPGDVIAIRKRKGDLFEEVHGYLYISDLLSYTKNGVDSGFHVLEPVSEIHLNYFVQPGCEVWSPSQLSIEECTYFVEAFDCGLGIDSQSISAFHPDLLDSYNRVETAERDMLSISPRFYEQWMKIETEKPEDELEALWPAFSKQWNQAYLDKVPMIRELQTMGSKMDKVVTGYSPKETKFWKVIRERIESDSWQLKTFLKDTSN